MFWNVLNQAGGLSTLIDVGGRVIRRHRRPRLYVGHEPARTPRLLRVGGPREHTLVLQNLGRRPSPSVEVGLLSVLVEEDGRWTPTQVHGKGTWPLFLTGPAGVAMQQDIPQGPTCHGVVLFWVVGPARISIPTTIDYELTAGGITHKSMKLPSTSFGPGRYRIHVQACDAAGTRTACCVEVHVEQGGDGVGVRQVPLDALVVGSRSLMTQSSYDEPGSTKASQSSGPSGRHTRP